MPNKSTETVLDLPYTPIQYFHLVCGNAFKGSAHPDSDWLQGTLRAKQYGRLLEWASELPSPQVHDSSTACFVETQLSSLIRKFPFTPSEIPGIDPRGSAVKSFRRAEHRCKRQNQKERAKRKNFDPYFQIREYARKYILDTIGIKPNLPRIFEKCDFTAGASLGVHGNATNIQRKIYAERWSVTPPALPLARMALWSNIHTRDCILPGAIKCYDYDEFTRLVDEKCERVAYNKISFVPKTAMTHRGMAVEPTLNGFLQKGIDEELRSLLRKTGLDLSDQTPNKVLAYFGTVQDFNPYATLDLSSASDSISIELVRDLLPAEWFELLTMVRSPWYMLDGQLAKYEKFCSMGNGFCFPLQTLIFASVCYAALRTFEGTKKQWYNFAVYGDDIVVPQNVALFVIEVLRELGFKTNRSKTFVTGPFRESCGADWFQGQDVRPVQFDQRMLDIRHLFSFHNTTLRSSLTEHFFSEVRTAMRKSHGSEFLRPGREPGDSCYSVPLDVAMCSRLTKWDKTRQCWVWHEIASNAVLDPGRLGEIERANVLLLAVLRGSDSRKPFALRYETTVKKRRISRWWYDGYSEPNDDLAKRVANYVGDAPLDVSLVREAVRRTTVR